MKLAPEVKAVILAGGPGTADFALANHYSKLAFRMPDGRPLLHHILSFLQESGVGDVAVTLSEQSNGKQSIVETLRAHDRPDFRVRLVIDSGFKGTAGSLKAVEEFIGSSLCLVINADVWPYGLDVSALLADHQAHGAAATALIEEVPQARFELERIDLDEKGLFDRFHSVHASRRHSRAFRLSGVYLFSPRVLEIMDREGYADIKEQLLAELRERSMVVHAHKLETPLRRIRSLDDYVSLIRGMLVDPHLGRGSTLSGRREIVDGVFIGGATDVSSRVYLLGPVVVGSNCTIESGAQIIGPTIIGDNTRIGKDVLIRESILWDSCHLSSKARVEYSVVTDGCSVSGRDAIRAATVVDGKVFNGDYGMAASAIGGTDRVLLAYNGRLKRRWLRQSVYRAGKRSLDLVLSSIGLVLSIPLFVLIALAIKRDSGGRVLFVQRRCGRDGKEFEMYKFRTMVNDAEKRLEDLARSKTTDGPVFKMVEDPRVTKLGRFLRATSLDELPQLYNVLKGDMSLVGPRPLVMDEMVLCAKWRDLRLKVKPGLTGLWQVNGRSSHSFEDWIRYDILYVKNQSFLLDLRILLRTVKMLVSRNGV